MVLAVILAGAAVMGSSVQASQQDCRFPIHGPPGSITCAMIQPASLDCSTPTVRRDRYERCVLYAEGPVISTYRPNHLVEGFLECEAVIETVSRVRSSQTRSTRQRSAYSNAAFMLRDGEDFAMISFHWSFRSTLEPPVIRAELQSLSCFGELLE